MRVIFCLVCGVGLAAGSCAQEAAKPRVILPHELVEPTLAEQVAAVERGESDRIHLIESEIGDDDLPRIAKLSSLRELLLDNSQVTSAGVKQLQPLPALEHLRLRGRPLDDVALAAAAEIKSLRILNLPRGSFTDDGVRSLAKLPNLVQLRLGGKQLNDRALAEMMQFPSLLRIHLLDAPITDAGLKAVHANRRLESLYLDGSQVTEQGLRDLFTALPELHVHIDQAHADFDPQKH